MEGWGPGKIIIATPTFWPQRFQITPPANTARALAFAVCMYASCDANGIRGMLALLAVPSWTAGWQQRCAPRLPSRCAACSRAPPLLLQALDPDADDVDTWRVDRARLNEQWSANIKKRRPRFLPFLEARQWARAMHMETEDDWREWIADGEKRNPYVPSRPDEVYSDSGWLGFHDFLNGPIEDLSTLLKPGYKRGKWLRGPLADMPPSDDK